MRAAGLLVVLIVTAACRAREPAPPAATAVPQDVRPGFGAHRHPIATTSPEAQQLFDHGMALVFAFNHEEAVKAFTRAAAVDPTAAMPHWGVAWALGPNYNLDVDEPRATRASAAMAKALALSAGGPPQERAYIEAQAIRFPNDVAPDRAALARRYADAMGEVAHRFPDDLDAATLHAEALMNLNAWKLWGLDGRPAAGTDRIVATLEGVLARDANHVGANHYFIHTVEASPRPDLALPSAGRLASLAPAAGHLVHMPAHVYARVGDHAKAADANRGGVAADRAFFRTAPSDTFYAMAYYAHNLHFLADSEMMRGRLGAARAAAADLVAQLSPHAAMMPMVESMIAMQHSVLLRFNRAEDILAAPAPAADRPVETAWWRFARGVALARQGKVADAAAERAALQTARSAVPDSALFGGTGLDSAAHVLGLATTVLDARLAWARGRKTEAVAIWRSAVATADTVPYDEPPIFYYPVRESLGAALLLYGDAAGAERVFREDLVKFPRNPRSLFGLAAALDRQGKSAEAAAVQRQFAEAWKDADAPLALDDL